MMRMESPLADVVIMRCGLTPYYLVQFSLWGSPPGLRVFEIGLSWELNYNLVFVIYQN